MSYVTNKSSGGGGGSGTVTSVAGGNNITITGTATINPTVNVSGATNHCVQIGNATNSLSSVTNGTTGQVLTATTGADPSWQNAASGGIVTLDGNSGSATGSTVTVTTPALSGTVAFAGSGSTLTLGLADSNANMIINSGGFSTSGIGNVLVGPNLLGSGVASGNFNAGMGYSVLGSLTSGTDNVGFGQQALVQLTTGNYNICMAGYQGGINYTSSESNNITLNASTTTVTGESNTLRIGEGTGTGRQQLNKTFIAGINGASVSGSPVLVNGSNQLGNGIMTNTNQPAFLVYLDTTTGNVTGDSTLAQIPYNHKVFDQATNFNTGTFLFTAPVTGKYQFNFAVLCLGGAGQTLFQLVLRTTASDYYTAFLNPLSAFSTQGAVGSAGSQFCNMTAGDTAGVYCLVNNAGLNVSFDGNQVYTWFSGFLVG